MTALQQLDSLNPHPALNWPIEITESAHIGDAVADELNQLSLFDSPLSDRHYGNYLWTVGSDEAPPLQLLGTDVPGDIHFRSEIVGVWEELQAAGFYTDPRNDDPISYQGEPVRYYPPVPRPCVGDPRMDPTVLEEGCMLPWMGPATFFGIDDEENRP